MYKSLENATRWGSGAVKTCGCKLSDTVGRKRPPDTSQLFGLKPAVAWAKPNFTRGEGPVSFGLKHPRFQDCSGCNAQILTCPLEGPQSQCARQRTLITYFVVEFARDVESPTIVTNTTQETVVKAMELRIQLEPLAPMPTVCVVNAGLHDMAIPNITDSVYCENVVWYLRLLQRVCDHTVWVQTTAVFLKWPHVGVLHPQRTDRIKLWNLLVERAITLEFGRAVTIMDVFAASVRWPHEDNVHLNRHWYDALGTVFIRAA
eukprot:m.156899 g.156899  ORF g.156899 m.156899 type:complete len:261 (-) comp23642_c1_seq1:167-949(-)